MPGFGRVSNIAANCRSFGLLLAICCGLISGCSRQETSPPPQALSANQQIELHNRAVGLMGRFDYEQAVKQLEQLVEAKPKSAALQVDLAIALLNRRQEGDVERSIDLLDKVSKRSPDDLRALYCRALLYFYNGELQDARKLFKQVAAADEADAYAIYYVGQTLLNEGEFLPALEQFRAAAEIDPYLRSASYGAFQAAQRAGEKDVAQEYFEVFQKLDTNPRARLAELKYTRMGPKAEIVASGQGASNAASPPPSGPVFNAMVELSISGGDDLPWRAWARQGPLPRITVADINGDGNSDLYITRAFDTTGGGPQNAVLLGQGGPGGGYAIDLEHPLAAAEQVNASLWGDYNNDGLVDVYLCCQGRNQLWRQFEDGTWTNVALESHASGGELNTIDGACYDFDHDGDVDYLLVHLDGSRELLSNNRDGTFRKLGEELGIAGRSSASQDVVIADFDSDDDADILFVKDSPPHEVLINDRLWNYRATQEYETLRSVPLKSALAIDADVDGQVELYAIGDGSVYEFARSETGAWQSKAISQKSARELAIVDCNGDSKLDLIRFHDTGWEWLPLEGSSANSLNSFEAGAEISPTVLFSSDGPEVIACRSGKPPVQWDAGSGRYKFVQLRLAGKIDKAAEMRSNASGIGASGVARIGDNWVPLPASEPTTFVGQSLQPQVIGLGGAPSADFIRLLWPDSVSQTELNLKPSGLVTIAETQRQAGSCPLVFVWDGERYVFVADVLGAGGIGFNLGRGEYYPPRPDESLLLPAGLPAPRDGRQIVKLGEPMEEICYFDQVRLLAYDLPPGWSMVLDERFAGMGTPPTGEPIFYRQILEPLQATNQAGKDVSQELKQTDGLASPIGRTDKRFIGLGNPHSVELTFGQPLEQFANPVVVFNSWVEYAYSQSAFAAWQAGLNFKEPTIEALGDDGQWKVVAERFGYPAGTSRQLAISLDPEALPAGTKSLRISTNMQVYWDKIVVVDAEQCPEARSTPLQLEKAVISDVGFSARTIGPQRMATYDYQDRPPFGSTRHPAGFYTAFGDALALVADTDDAVAIIGPGEELHLEFLALEHEPADSWQRHYVLQTAGWCKDADLFTKDSGTVEPLPTRDPSGENEYDARRRQLHQKYNTRYRSGW